MHVGAILLLRDLRATIVIELALLGSVKRRVCIVLKEGIAYFLTLLYEDQPTRSVHSVHESIQDSASLA